MLLLIYYVRLNLLPNFWSHRDRMELMVRLMKSGVVSLAFVIVLHEIFYVISHVFPIKTATHFLQSLVSP